MSIGASANFSDSEDDSSDLSEETKRKRAYSIEQAEKKRHVKSREEIERIALENGDLYAILELEHKTWEAKDKEIRKGYQKLALRFHPDKLGDAITEQGKQMWLKIQLAYDTLTDPARRRRYDSTLPFDDSIPKQGDWNDETFYEVFNEVFERNSMWALKRPVPKIGNHETPISEVKAFYKYWDNFESWREFAQYDEHKPEEA
jgi:DnaJ family protein C protein 2